MSKDLALAAAGSVLLHALCIAVPFSASTDLGEDGTAPDFRVIGTVCLIGGLEGDPEDGPSPLPVPAAAEPVESRGQPAATDPPASERPPPMPVAAEDERFPSVTETACLEPPEGEPIDPQRVEPAPFQKPAPHQMHPLPTADNVPAARPVASAGPESKLPDLEKKPAPLLPPGPAGSAAAGQTGIPGDREAARGTTGGLREKYLAALLRKIQAEKRYPSDARWRGWEGEAEVKIALGADGSLLDVQLEKSSCHGVLDEEATDMIRRAAPFPPLPKELGLSRWRLVIPIRFRLEDRK